MSQYDIVEFLNNNKQDKYTCKELSKEFNITVSSMGRLLSICFKSRFIQREVKSQDFPIEYIYFTTV